MNSIKLTQQIKLAWLDFTVQQCLKDESSTAIQTALVDFLGGQNLSKTQQQKIIRILLKIWIKVPQSLESFRDEGLSLFRKIPLKQHIAIHWGMMMAIYPFFATVAEQMGRLLQLQNEVSHTQLQKRLYEKIGERTVVATAVSQLIACWIEWGVLISIKKNTYTAAEKQPITHVQLTTWLLESGLRARESQSVILNTLINHSPAFFPFQLSSYYFIPNERLELLSHGVNEVNVTFKKK